MDNNENTWEDNRWFMRAIRYTYNELIEPVILFVEGLSSERTKKFVDTNTPKQ